MVKCTFHTGKTDYLSTHQVLAIQRCVEMWFIKVILLGAPRLGKTTARRRLTGDIADISSSGEGTQPSTGAVVIRSLSSTAALVTPSEWTASMNLTDEACMLFQYLFRHYQDEDSATHTDKIESKAQAEGSHSKPGQTAPHSKRKSKGFKLHNFFKSKKDSSVKVDEARISNEGAQVVSEVVGLVHDSNSPQQWMQVEHLFGDTVFVKMEDTGGQPEFMDMLPALTIGPALYLFFCKLTDNLKSRYTVSYLASDLVSPRINLHNGGGAPHSPSQHLLLPVLLPTSSTQQWRH